MRDGRLIRPHGKSGTLRIRVPQAVPLPGRLMEARLSYGVLRLVCAVADAPRPQQTVIGVDLGVHTLIAATDGPKVFLVHGRGVKAVIQWRNKTLAEIQQAPSRKTKGSCRWKRLQRRKYRVLDTTKRQVRDATHNATHAIAAAFPGATCSVGEPFNDAAQRTGRVQAQQVSTACTRQIIQQLDDKTAGVITRSEASSSQTCPVGGERSKHRRIDTCPHCGATGPRDAVGAVHILRLGRHGAMVPCSQVVPCPRRCSICALGAGVPADNRHVARREPRSPRLQPWGVVTRRDSATSPLKGRGRRFTGPGKMSGFIPILMRGQASSGQSVHCAQSSVRIGSG